MILNPNIDDSSDHIFQKAFGPAAHKSDFEIYGNTLFKNNNLLKKCLSAPKTGMKMCCDAFHAPISTGNRFPILGYTVSSDCF